MSKFHKNADISLVVNLNSALISDMENLYVLVVNPMGVVVKQLSLVAQNGFIDEDLNQIDDVSVEVIIHRRETQGWDYGQYYFQVRSSTSSSDFFDSVKIDSDSDRAFRLVTDRERTKTVDGVDINLPNAGIQDAPQDGDLYGRQDGEWISVGDAIGAVTSVNGLTGAVLLTQDEVPEGITYRRITQAEKDSYAAKLDDADSDGLIYGRQDGAWVEIQTGSGDANLTEDVEVIGVGTVGAVSDGDILPEGQSFTDTMKQILQQVVPPTYNQPTLSLSANPSSTQEIGATLDYLLTPSYNQNDAGALDGVEYFRSGGSIQTQADLSPYNDTSRTVQAGNITYRVEVSYLDGVIKDDNFGNPDPTGRILAGTIGANRNVTGSYRNFYGAYGVLPPNDGNDVRTLGYSYNNTFTLNTGTTALYHVIAVPSTRSLVSVIDVDALNADLVASYVLSGTITTVPDGGGNAVAYNVHVLNIAQAYSSNHRHNVTIS